MSLAWDNTDLRRRTGRIDLSSLLAEVDSGFRIIDYHDRLTTQPQSNERTVVVLAPVLELVPKQN